MKSLRWGMVAVAIAIGGCAAKPFPTYSPAEIAAAKAALETRGGFNKSLVSAAVVQQTPLGACVRVCEKQYDRCDPKKWAEGTCDAWYVQCVGLCHTKYGG